MTRVTRTLVIPAAIAMIGAYHAAIAGEQDAIDGCIDRLRAVGGPDAKAGGEVLSSEFSQAATLVMLRDAGSTVWRCLAYSDGTVGELSVSQAADDGGWLFQALGLSIGGGVIGASVPALVGAVLVLLVVKAIRRRG